MSEHPNLAAALVAALDGVSVVEKTEKAGAGTGRTWTYATIAELVKATRPALAEHGLVALTPVHEHGSGLACTVVLLHSSGERMDFGPFPFPHGKDAQATGSMVTYHRRYALLSALGMGAEDDDGVAAKPRQEQRPKVVQFDPSPPDRLEGNDMLAPSRDQPQTAPVEEQTTSWVEPAPGAKYASSRQVNQIKEAAKRLPEEQRADLVEWGKGNATVYGVDLLRDGKIVATQEAAETVLTSLNALLATGVAEPKELVSTAVDSNTEPF